MLNWHSINTWRIWVPASQVVTSGANFATTLILVRALDIDEFGRFAACFMIIMIARNFLGGFILTPMSSIGPKLHPATTPAYRYILISHTLTFSTATSLIIALFCVSLDMPWLEAITLSFIMANFLAMGSDFIKRYWIVYKNPFWSFLVESLRHLVQVVGILVLAIFWPSLLSTDTALWCMAAGALVGAVFGAVGFGRVVRSNRLRRVLRPRIANFAVWMTPAVAIEAIQMSGVMLYCGFLLGEAQMGRLRAMQSLAAIISLPFQALQQNQISRAADAYSSGGVDELWRTIVKAWHYVIIVGCLAVLIVLLLGSSMIELLFGLDVDQNIDLFYFFSGYYLFLLLRSPIQFYLLAIESPARFTRAEAFGCIVTLMIIFLFADNQGVLVAPASLLAGVILSTAVLTYDFLRIRGAGRGSRVQ